MRALFGVTTTIALIGAVSAPALAQQSLHSQLEGVWKVTADYDQFTDGHKRNPMGNNPQGMAGFTPSGTFIFELMSGDRSAKSGTGPVDPVGPAIAFFATYTVDEQNKTYTYHVQTANELPPLLDAAEADGLVILPVLVSPCRFMKTLAISRFQSVNPPSEPLIAISRAESEATLVKVTDAIEKAIVGRSAA